MALPESAPNPLARTPVETRTGEQISRIWL